ncbi:MAG: transcription antitermination factor NusB [Longimicrobiales bacterium]
MRERRGARSWALQVLYVWESRRSASVRDVLNEFYQTRSVGEAKRPYLRELIDLLEEHLPEIDHALDGALTNWRLERLSVIDRNILRLGAAELLLQEDVPPRVAISEALLLAEKYGNEESVRFVNGVLDALRREQRRAGTGGGVRH